MENFSTVGGKALTEDSVYGNHCAIHDCHSFSYSSVHVRIYIPAENTIYS